MKTNTILTALALALCLGVAPQAQGMAYFKAAYHNAYAWGKKATHTALTVKDMALTRMAAIVNHIVPQSYKKSAHSEVAINRISTIVNHLQPEVAKPANDHKSLNRAQMIVNHVSANTQEDKAADKAKPDIFEFDKNTPAQMVAGYLAWFYSVNAENVSSIIGNEIGREEIFDTDDNLIGHIIYYLKNEEDSQQIFVRFVNKENMLLGFSVAKIINNEQKEGYISFLHVDQTTRKSGLGKVLLAYTTKKLYEFNCKKISGRASSFDLKQGEDHSTMQPKLESFYGQFGAQSVDGSTNKLGLSLQ